MKRREFLKHTGCGIAAWLGGSAIATPQCTTFPHFPPGLSLSIHDGAWKLVYCPHSQTPPFRLYNLQQDTGEYWDIATKYPEIVERMTKRLLTSKA